MLKKKINVIKPTLRHKKRYITINFLESKELTKKDIFYIVSKNFRNIYGLFAYLDANIYLVDFVDKNKSVIFRVNKDYLRKFIGSLLFLNKTMGLITVKHINTTLKSENNK